ncbi:hypothetical protein ILYODFUR_024049 [Ilyodon furcidens]|uniref:Uncharacterized protein n=1 Tax=Ilyodon furcidens TaxID=33524 RepID=A0ABV0UIN8_9TELE
MGPRLCRTVRRHVPRSIQALRSVLNSFSVVNRKNMFVYQERTTKSVFYLRLCETSLTGKYSDLEGNLHPIRSMGLFRSQEPFYSEDLMGSRSSLESSRPVGQVDKHILLLVHGVDNAAGPTTTNPTPLPEPCRRSLLFNIVLAEPTFFGNELLFSPLDQLYRCINI